MSKRYNVLFIFHCSDVNNGGVRSMLDVIEQLVKKEELKIYAAFPDKSGSAIQYLFDLGIGIVPFCLATWHHQKTGNIKMDFTDVAKIIIKQYRNLNFIFRIGSFIQDNNINCIYTNTFATYIGAICSKKYGVYHIWHIREFGEQDHNMRPLFGWKRLYSMLNKYTNKVLVISNSLYDRYEPYVEKTKLEVIYDDVSTDYIIGKKEKSAEPLKLLIAGTIQAGKRQLEAVQAVEMVLAKGAFVHLYIAGGDVNPYAQLVREYVKKHKLEQNITFLGYVSEMSRLRSEMDVGLVCSQSEAFGRVTVEGMLAHMAMIGANCAGTKELIRDRETGLLYELGNAEQLAEKILELYQDRNKLQRLSEAGFSNAKLQFASGKCAETVWKCIKNSIYY